MKLVEVYTGEDCIGLIEYEDDNEVSIRTGPDSITRIPKSNVALIKDMTRSELNLYRIQRLINLVNAI